MNLGLPQRVLILFPVSYGQFLLDNDHYNQFRYICTFTNKLLQKELQYLEKVFSYPEYVIKQVLKQVQDEQNQQNVNVLTTAIPPKTKTKEKKCVTCTISRKNKETMSLSPQRKE